jgi:hypothetical protein
VSYSLVGTRQYLSELRNQYLIGVLVVLLQIFDRFPKVHLFHDSNDPCDGEIFTVAEAIIVVPGYDQINPGM